MSEYTLACHEEAHCFGCALCNSQSISYVLLSPLLNKSDAPSLHAIPLSAVLEEGDFALQLSAEAWRQMSAHYAFLDGESFMKAANLDHVNLGAITVLYSGAPQHKCTWCLRVRILTGATTPEYRHFGDGFLWPLHYLTAIHIRTELRKDPSGDASNLASSWCQPSPSDFHPRDFGGWLVESVPSWYELAEMIPEEQLDTCWGFTHAYMVASGWPAPRPLLRSESKPHLLDLQPWQRRLLEPAPVATPPSRRVVQRRRRTHTDFLSCGETLPRELFDTIVAKLLADPDGWSAVLQLRLASR